MRIWTRIFVMGGVLATIAVLAQPDVGFGQKEDPIPRAWIYRDNPAPNGKKPHEGYYEPYFYFPVTVTSKITVDTKKSASDLDPNEKGTCVEFTFSDLKGTEFAGAGFVPEGNLETEQPPLNIAKELLVGFDRPVFLKFRARTKAKQTVKVRFEACGLSNGALADGIRPAQVPEPAVTVLNDKWKDVIIDLTRKSAGLEKVACPLKVIIRADENPGNYEIIVYVDDIRFEVSRPQK